MHVINREVWDVTELHLLLQQCVSRRQGSSTCRLLQIGALGTGVLGTGFGSVGLGTGSGKSSSTGSGAEGAVAVAGGVETGAVGTGAVATGALGTGALGSGSGRLLGLGTGTGTSLIRLVVSPLSIASTASWAQHFFVSTRHV
jgi:hypothetical protein